MILMFLIHLLMQLESKKCTVIKMESIKSYKFAVLRERFVLYNHLLVVY
jgi:hypothetical protein